MSVLWCVFCSSWGDSAAAAGHGWYVNINSKVAFAKRRPVRLTGEVFWNSIYMDSRGSKQTKENKQVENALGFVHIMYLHPRE